MIKKTLHILTLLICLSCGNAYAALSKKASLVVDLHNGKILHALNERELRYPASLVKMMTLYLTFKELKAGRLTLEQKLPVSAKAAAMPRLNIALRKGDKVTVHKAILGIIVHSANDAAVVLAEAIGGSEVNFATLMTEQAKKLGMNNTKFMNASGLPNKQQKTTAYDLAKLAIALKQNFPQYFSWFSINSFSVDGRTYKSHNRVVQNYQWATGLKTGFTCASGFNLATTANKDGKHLVGIVLGGDTARARDSYMIKLLNSCFAKSGSIKDKKPSSSKTMVALPTIKYKRSK
jgi:D-alanyl-D-alanine carboxypeptidase